MRFAPFGVRVPEMRGPLFSDLLPPQAGQRMKHSQALIALARRRCNVLFAMLLDGTIYEAPEALAA